MNALGRLRSFRLGRRDPAERAAYSLYGAVVEASRAAVFHTELGVPDTLDGRFDLMALHGTLLIRRLRAAAAPGPALAQSLFDAMFHDMDVNLREMGVGDLAVGKKVRAMWEAFHGRATVYEQALGTGDRDALAAAIGRNVWRGIPQATKAAALARLAFAQDAHLARQSIDRLAAGEVSFLPASEALA